jgi:hypothetical protein
LLTFDKRQPFVFGEVCEVLGVQSSSCVIEHRRDAYRPL